MPSLRIPVSCVEIALPYLAYQGISFENFRLKRLGLLSLYPFHLFLSHVAGLKQTTLNIRNLLAIMSFPKKLMRTTLTHTLNILQPLIQIVINIGLFLAV